MVSKMLNKCIRMVEKISMLCSIRNAAIARGEDDDKEDNLKKAQYKKKKNAKSSICGVGGGKREIKVCLGKADVEMKMMKQLESLKENENKNTKSKNSKINNNNNNKIKRQQKNRIKKGSSLEGKTRRKRRNVSTFFPESKRMKKGEEEEDGGKCDKKNFIEDNKSNIKQLCVLPSIGNNDGDHKNPCKKTLVFGGAMDAYKDKVVDNTNSSSTKNDKTIKKEKLVKKVNDNIFDKIKKKSKNAGIVSTITTNNINNNNNNNNNNSDNSGEGGRKGPKRNHKGETQLHIACIKVLPSSS